MKRDTHSRILLRWWWWWWFSNNITKRARNTHNNMKRQFHEGLKGKLLGLNHERSNCSRCAREIARRTDILTVCLCWVEEVLGLVCVECEDRSDAVRLWSRFYKYTANTKCKLKPETIAQYQGTVRYCSPRWICPVVRVLKMFVWNVLRNKPVLSMHTKISRSIITAQKFPGWKVNSPQSEAIAEQGHGVQPGEPEENFPRVGSSNGFDLNTRLSIPHGDPSAEGLSGDRSTARAATTVLCDSQVNGCSFLSVGWSVCSPLRDTSLGNTRGHTS